MVQNRALLFKEYPTHSIEAGKHVNVEDVGDFDLEQAVSPSISYQGQCVQADDVVQPPSGGLTVKVHYVSFDPYQRGRMRKPEIKSYSPPFDLGKPITNSAVVTVLKSDHEKFKAGDKLYVPLTNTEEYSALSKDLANSAIVLQNPYNLDERLFTGALGMPGLTAYSSFYEIGEPKKGETIFISAASGAVGQLVGQLAKHEGLKVVGSVGDDKKLEFITKELGFDGGFNYKKEKPLDALKRLAPDGIDIYYENVSRDQADKLSGTQEVVLSLNDTGRR